MQIQVSILLLLPLVHFLFSTHIYYITTDALLIVIYAYEYKCFICETASLIHTFIFLCQCEINNKLAAS